MTAYMGVRRHAVVEGTFTRSMLAAAARGLGLVAVAVGVGVILLQATDEGGGPSVSIDVAAGSDETTTTTTDGLGPGAGLRPPSQVQVLVLNAARVEGVAGTITEKLQQIGHPTLPPGNAPPQDETVVYYKPGFEAEAATVAPEVSETTLTQPLSDPSPFAGTEEADLVIVLGTNFAGDSGGTDSGGTDSGGTDSGGTDTTDTTA
ncbi:MAG: LytR C-terminal domain-containing protein [Actinobacteria bacterium]|nr:LytR C-terminal domain-containing protein [Actinomycetota bacterium]